MDGVVAPISGIADPKSARSVYPIMQSATTDVGARRIESECEIVKEHQAKIRHMAIPFAHRVPLDDLMQEGCIALIEASRTYEASRGVQLWTYACRAVFWALLRCVAQAKRDPSRFLDGGINDDNASVTQLLSEDPAPDEIAELGEDLTILEEEIDALSDDERNVLWQLFGEDKTSRDAATALGSTHGFVVRTKLNAIEKLRARMEARS